MFAIRLSAFILLFCLSGLSQARTSDVSVPPPRNQALLGPSTYERVSLQKLPNARLVWADGHLLIERGISRPEILNRWGYAGKVEGELYGQYSPESILGYASRYGGFDLGYSLGDGRAVIIDQDYQSKGASQTMMVSPMSVQGHRNGAATLSEGILESLWGALLNYEMPYGAYRSVALIFTGSMVTPDGKSYVPRALIIREDLIRVAHLLLNLTAKKMGITADQEHVAWAMEHLLDLLPKPTGSLPESAVEKFLVQTNEMIDRQAIQAGYAWAHSMVHGGIDAANVGLDGRVLDYGTFSAFDGYPRVQLIPPDEGTVGGFSGDTVDFRNTMLKEVYESWQKTLPKNFLAVLPPKKAWDDRFDATFARTQRQEMLKLAGAFPELIADLEPTSEGRELSNLLIEIALAGNSQPVETWKNKSPFGRGQYSLPKILASLARANLGDLDGANNQLQRLISDSSIRQRLIVTYNHLFTLERSMLGRYGIRPDREQRYRLLASVHRNRKMDGHFRNEKNLNDIQNLVTQFMKDGDSSKIQTYIDEKVASSRREFRDAAPFTLVLGESVINGHYVRNIFDARAGAPLPACAKMLAHELN